jgi:hypothetical protein
MRVHLQTRSAYTGEPAVLEKVNRKPWWPAELSVEGGAASSVYR